MNTTHISEPALCCALSRPIKLLLLLLFLLPFSLSAQFYYNETCRGDTGAFKPAGTHAGYTAGSMDIDPDGDGWLRLTDASLTSRGYVLLDGTFPSNMGVVVEFDFKIWAKNISLVPADGISVFLFDGDPDSTFAIGAWGGSLGYVNLKPGYMGVGIDEYGGFTGGRPHAIAVRNSAYERVSTTADSLKNITELGDKTLLAWTVSTPTRPTDAQIYRRVKIEMDPITGDDEGMFVTVYLKTSTGGDYVKIIDSVEVIQPTPPTLRLGFAASTGSHWAYHEVRDVIIRTPGDMQVFKSIDECAPPNDVRIHTRVVNNTTSEVNGIVMNDTLPANFEVDSFRIIQPSSGSGLTPAKFEVGDRWVYIWTVTVPANDNIQITYYGHFDAIPPEESYTSSVILSDLPDGFVDPNTADNYATVTGLFYLLSAPAVDVLLTNSPATLTVSATNSPRVTSYAWAQSVDNGGAWTPLASTSASHTHTAGKMSLLVRCIARWDTGCSDTLVFRCIPAPDNIGESQCFIDIPSITWSMKEAFKSDASRQKMTAYTTPLVGDLDGDGKPEVIVYNFLDGNDPRTVDSVYVFWGHDRANPTRFKIPTTSYMHPMGALAR
ncbi:MAG: DUF11 domain-containing protein, partial [Tannerella sp.]|nr:DUF11 domain-containing protein [Tannerella sp.]